MIVECKTRFEFSRKNSVNIWEWSINFCAIYCTDSYFFEIVGVANSQCVKFIRHKHATISCVVDTFKNGMRVFRNELLHMFVNKCQLSGLFHQTTSLHSRTVSANRAANHPRITVMVVFPNTIVTPYVARKSRNMMSNRSRRTSAGPSRIPFSRRVHAAISPVVIMLVLLAKVV